MDLPKRIERPWSPTQEQARLEFQTMLDQYGKQIDPAKGLQCWINYRDMVGRMFPGNVPAPFAVAILTIVAANAVSSLMEQLEESVAGDTPEAVGRRKAIVNIFEEILNNCADERERLRLQKLFKPN